MTTATAPTPVSDPVLPVLDSRPVPFVRLTRVELRKTVDTRAGLWLLVIVAAAALAIIGGTLIWSAGPHSLSEFLTSTVLPLSLLVPIIGVMAATAEWTQRTGLVTFTLEPRRGRVVAAKVVAALLLGLVVLAATLLASVLATLVAGAAFDVGGLTVAGLALGVLLYVLQGVAFGMALMNTPAAIVASLVLPTVWMIASGLISGIETVSEWLNLNNALIPLMYGEMTGTAWAHLATSAALWIGVPMAIGVRRVLTREVK
jgi:ABC-2 type transport system permease protein